MEQRYERDDQKIEWLQAQLAQAKVDRDRAAEGTEWLRVKMEEMNLQNGELKKFIEEMYGSGKTREEVDAILGKIEKRKCSCSTIPHYAYCEAAEKREDKFFHFPGHQCPTCDAARKSEIQ